MFATLLENILYGALFLFIIGLSTLKQIHNEFKIEYNPGSNTAYGANKEEIIFLDDHGHKIFGYFHANHSILDHLEMAIYDFNKHFPSIINETLTSDSEKKFFGFYKDNITFTLYTRDRINGTVLINVKQLPEGFDETKKNVFCTHGWMNSKYSPTCQIIKKKCLRNFDVNFFIVDWSIIANIPIYPVPAASIRIVAVYYSNFVNDLIEKKGVKLYNLHLIGHSLGAHLSGFTGRLIRKGKVSRITGLDPALPSFTITATDHLNVNDSEFVDIIHTCAGFLGIKEPIGHVDFYPNGGGPPQPGCESDWKIMESCSHGKSYELFADSIGQRDRFRSLAQGPVETCYLIPMGYHTPHYIRGIYFLKTE